MREATLKIEIRPKENRIIGTGYFPILTKVGRPAFYINKDFKINNVEDEMGDIGFAVANEENPLPFVQKSRPVHLHKGADSLKIEYEGTLAKPTGMCNVITQDRIELSMHSCFYPIFMNHDFDSIRVTYSYPQEYSIWTNGKGTEGIEIKYSYEEYTKGIFIYAEKSPCVLRSNEKDYTVEIVGSDRRHELISFDEVNCISEIIEFYGRKLQVGLDDTEITVIYSNRGCGAYVFGQKITIPVKSEFGFLSTKTKITSLIAHEIAHFYWNFADLSGNNDWITEGMAEYLTFSYIIEKKEKTDIKELLNEQYNHILGCVTDDSILTTDIGSKDFNQNRGTKLAWLYFVIQQRYEDFDRCMSDLLKKYKTMKIDTETYLAYLQAKLSSEMYDFLTHFLNKNGWSRSDTAFLYKIILRYI